MHFRIVKNASKFSKLNGYKPLHIAISSGIDYFCTKINSQNFFIYEKIKNVDACRHPDLRRNNGAYLV